MDKRKAQEFPVGCTLLRDVSVRNAGSRSEGLQRASVALVVATLTPKLYIEEAVPSRQERLPEASAVMPSVKKKALEMIKMKFQIFVKNTENLFSNQEKYKIVEMDLLSEVPERSFLGFCMASETILHSNLDPQALRFGVGSKI